MSALPPQIQDAATYFSNLERSAASLLPEQIDRIARLLCRAYEQQKITYLFGNGGSASLASHFACDLAKGTWIPGSDLKRFRAIALTDNVPILTAWANDSGYDEVFAGQIRGIIGPGDVAFAISCSGNSRNVLNGLQVARESGALTIGLSGFKGGAMKELCDMSLVVDSDNMQIIEDLHLSIAHCLFTLIKAHIGAQIAPKVVAARAS